MTNKSSGTLIGLPFIVRYAKPALEVPVYTFRYDPDRQMSQVLADGMWVDSTQALVEASGTRLTRVRGETTDDQ